MGRCGIEHDPVQHLQADVHVRHGDFLRYGDGKKAAYGRDRSRCRAREYSNLDQPDDPLTELTRHIEYAIGTASWTNMTYCLAITVDSGLVFVSDSRTSAGVDMVSTYSKMYGFGVPGERQLTLMTSGNLATSQAVINRIKKDIRQNSEVNLLNQDHMADIAAYVGEISRETQSKSETADVNVESNFIVGGQVINHNPHIFLVYPQGNYISTSSDTSFLQIGEAKYGKPILDRIVSPEISLETAAMCALVSMDSTMRSNLTVGPPIELSIYKKDSLNPGRYYRFEEDSKYLRRLKKAWDNSLKEAFKQLPPVTWSETWDAIQGDETQEGTS
jgi:putative proteasome-type protease